MTNDGIFKRKRKKREKRHWLANNAPFVSFIFAFEKKRKKTFTQFGNYTLARSPPLEFNQKGKKER